MRILIAVTAALLSGLIISCSDDESADGDLTAIDLPVGSENTYLFTVTEDSVGIKKETYRDTFAVRIESTGDSIAGYSGLVKLKAYKVSDQSLYSVSWHRQTGSEYVDIAYQFAGRTPVVFPKKGLPAGPGAGAGFSIEMNLRRLTMHFGSSEDTVVRTDLRYVYKYPLSTGRTWTSFNVPFMQTREVKGYETITTQSGTYRCAKIMSALPVIAPGMEWYDHIANEGLIMRTIADSMVLATVENPDGNGIKEKITQRFELIRRTLR